MADQAHTTEQWLPVPGFEGIYEVSSRGSVRSLDRVIKVAKARRAGGKPYAKRVRGRVLSQVNSLKNGYLTVGLNKEGKARFVSTHVLVAAAFIGPRPSGFVIAHGDGNKRNNSAANLRYATYSENALDKNLHGTSPRGEQNGSARLSEEQVREIRFHSSGLTVKSLAERYCVSASSIHKIIHGDRWKHLTA